MRSGFLLLYLTLVIICLTHCDAERSMRVSKGAKHGRILRHKHTKKLRLAFEDFDSSSLEFSNAQSLASSSPLPPYESLAPVNSPPTPFCYPPPPPPTGLQLPPPGPSGSLSTPTPQSIPNSPDMGSPLQNPPIIIPGPPGNIPTSPGSTTSPPSGGTGPGSPEPIQNPPIILPGPPGSMISPPSTIPSPSGGTGPDSPEPIQNPPIVLPNPPGSTTTPPGTMPSPSGGTGPGSPEPIQNPPSTVPPPPNEGSIPGPPEPIQNPPIILPGPPGSIPNPSPGGGGGGGGGGGVPSPTVFEPPVVYPPPSVPPPPRRMAPSGALWCVAKPSVPDPIMQEAMNYACGSGAQCDPIQPNGPCFEPDTVIAHTSFAFNSLWQNSKSTGGTCDFGGTGMLVSEDPSYNGCNFVYS